jgi:hypothetical protein
MTYACPTWEFVEDTQLLKLQRLQRLQNRVRRVLNDFDRRTQVHDLHLALKIPYVYDHIIKLCRRQAEVIQNHQYPNGHAIGQ